MQAGEAPRDRSWLLPALVFLGAMALAGQLYADYWHTARSRWSCLAHDRNAHYLLGLSLAMDVRHVDLRQMFSDLDGARTWPPLHGIIEGVVLFVGGPEHRLAVLPSLFAWVGTIVLGFLLARRLLREGGDLAGLLAVVFIVSSPAHRVFATDTMLESLGGFLTLLSLYLYVRAVQEGSLRIWTALGAALTALFLHKSNYWLLVLLALTGAEITLHFREGLQVLRGWWSEVEAGPWLRAQVREPLNYLVLLLAAVVVVFVFRERFALSSEHVSLRSPHNILNAAYAALCLRLAVGWWRTRAAWSEHVSPRVGRLIVWHVLPVMGWFLLPKKLGYWLFYMNPATNAGEVPQHGWISGLQFYWAALIHDYHLGVWSAVLALGLMALLVFGRWNLREGTRGVVFLVIIATVLMVPHPNRKSRFFHSWIAAGWVLSGAGLASLAYARRLEMLGKVRPWLVGAAVGGLALAHAPGMVSAGHSPEFGHNVPEPSTRDLTDFYLPYIAASRHTTLLCNTEMKFVARWSVLERFGNRDKLEVDIKNYRQTPEQNRKAFDQWLTTTRSDTVLFIDLDPDSYFYVPTGYNEPYGRLRGYMEEQTLFRIQEVKVFPEFKCRVVVWERR